MRFSRAAIFATSLMLILFGAGWPTPAAAQNAPALHGPDILGIYTGMPVAAARAQLQKRSDSIRVTDDSLGFGLSIPDPAHRDMIHVSFTQPPNDAAV